MAHPDVLIVGGGVIGAATAYYLSALGVKVTLLERRQAGGHASVAAAAILHPFATQDAPEPYRRLSRLSMAMFPALTVAIRETTGIDPSFQQCGWLRVALTEAGVDELRARLGSAADDGLDTTWLNPAQVRELEPVLAPVVLAALFHRAGAHLYAPSYLRGLLRAAAMRGATVRTGVEVARLCVDGERVTGVQLADGGSVTAGQTVVAGGAWTSILLDSIGTPVPVRPMRGQILSLHATPPIVRHVVHGSEILLAPKVDGSIVVGATYEDAGFDDRLTAEGVGGLLDRALRLAPALGSATFRRAWVGLRPCTPDDMPILGRVRSWDGLTIAAGHGREGILLSPITGTLLAQHLTGNALDMPIEAFGLQRFSPSTG